MKKLTILACALLLISSSAMAFDLKKILKDKVQDAAEDIVNELIPSIEDFKVDKAEPLPEANVDMDWVETNQNIVMYSTESCGYCVRLRKYLVRNNIPFIEKDVNSDQQYRSEFEALNGRGVPLSLVKNNRVAGFDENNWNKLLEQNGFK